jgi:hypothetical protein
MWPRSSPGIPPPDDASCFHAGNCCCARSPWLSQPCETMPSSTKFHRSTDRSGLCAGSQREGDWMMPASIAPSETVRSPTFLPKYACEAAWIPYAPRPR